MENDQIAVMQSGQKNDDDIAALPTAPQPSPQEPAGRPETRPIRVLLVEDNPADAHLIRLAITQSGGRDLEVTHVESLKEALDRLAACDMDIVLLDLSLPDADGLDTVSRTRAAAPATPIVVLTGQYDDETYGLRAVREGSQDYLVKGEITGDLLVRAIRYALERQRLTRELDHVRQQQLRLKDEFLSHVSHELRTPLAATHQFVTILLDGLAGDLSGEQRDYLNIVLKNIGQLRSMIGDLLDITRAEIGKLTVLPRRTFIGEVINETVTTMNPAATEKGINMKVEVPSDLPLIYADPERIRQVLVNLIGNAIKFTPEGGSITVAANVTADRASVAISVTDTGCGISANDQTQIFERLYQTKEVQPGSRSGLGLGLYISKQLITRQGGNLWVESEVGKGSSFTFTLPVFSVVDLLQPVVTRSGRDNESIVLLTVELFSPDAKLPKNVRERVLRQAYEELEGSTFPDDVVIPGTNSRSGEGVFHVIGWLAPSDVPSMADRIRTVLSDCPVIKGAGLNPDVTARIVDLPQTGNVQIEEAMKSFSTLIESLIENS